MSPGVQVHVKQAVQLVSKPCPVRELTNTESKGDEMDYEIAKQIFDASEYAADNLQGFDLKVELKPDYSGRGMYGKSTAALVVTDPVTLAVAVGFAVYEALALGNDQIPTLAAIKEARTDNLGNDLIVY
jgi:hypothetical protein